MAPLDSVGANEVSRTWWQYFPWEDADFGATLELSGVQLSNDKGFKDAYDPCSKRTSVKNLDFDAPALVRGLHEQERSGLWSHKTIEYSSGPYRSYGGWYRFTRAFAKHNLTYDAWPAEMLAEKILSDDIM